MPNKAIKKRTRINLDMRHHFKMTIPLAIFITFIAVIYQRGTGPTYPKKIKIESSEHKITVKFPRSHGGETDALVSIPIISKDMTGQIHYKRFPTNDAWTSAELVKTKNSLTFNLPHQPPAGKIIYHVDLSYEGKVQKIHSKKDPIFIRFKGDVPAFVLTPHIFFMFFSMLLGMLAALEALKGGAFFSRITHLTTGSLVIGGMILGPIVQKYAFGVYWAGFPYDWDLTDNKLLISVIVWVLASATNFKKPNKFFVILAAAVLFGMYSIPHSTMGSQYNYEKGQVETDR